MGADGRTLANSATHLHRERLMSWDAHQCTLGNASPVYSRSPNQTSHTKWLQQYSRELPLCKMLRRPAGCSKFSSGHFWSQATLMPNDSIILQVIEGALWEVLTRGRGPGRGPGAAHSQRAQRPQRGARGAGPQRCIWRRTPDQAAPAAAVGLCAASAAGGPPALQILSSYSCTEEHR